MNKKFIIIALISVVVISAVLLIKPKTSNESVENSVTNNDSKQVVIKQEESTISSEWQWTEPSSGASNSEDGVDEGESDAKRLPFTPQTVHDALSAVKIDDDGNIILDNDALISLDEALERIYNLLDGESVLELQDLIRDALPGSVGAQTAEIVSNYTDYLKAKEQFSILHENTVYNDAEQTIQTLERDEDLYSELQSLREVHLGRDVTQQLFRDHDASAQYMFDNMKLGLDDTLTPEVREQRRQEIEDRFRAIVPLEVEPAPEPEAPNQG